MKILVACEESQAVTVELRKLGHEAYSCDILPCSGGHPEWHILGDVRNVLNGNAIFRVSNGKIRCIDGKWDMIIAFPPCTYLTNAGARHLWKGGILETVRRKQRQHEEMQRHMYGSIKEIQNANIKGTSYKLNVEDRKILIPAC